MLVIFNNPHFIDNVHADIDKHARWIGNIRPWGLEVDFNITGFRMFKSYTHS